MEGFVYVVNPPAVPRVAFGSGLERVTLPLGGPCLSPFMRQLQGEVHEFPGPADYFIVRAFDRRVTPKVRSSMFASQVDRFPAAKSPACPPIGAYDVDVKRGPCPRSLKPFGSGAPRAQKQPFLTPAPTAYAPHLPPPRPTISSAFGSKRVTRPAVAVICAPFNAAKCHKCGRTPCGDYWRNGAANLDLCRPCMGRERAVLRSCATGQARRERRRRQLRHFQPVRYCGFFHDHKGTTAAAQIMSTKELLFKTRKENYLFRYLTPP